ncbi:hypothetical protein GIB67_004532 [Kingdonia uniflora]|uniref:RNase H type-1 domain-containing protein n=1 Tax=Kingdonia uniflora TaxID=39325 RepID=A0A7J7MLC7_9MAGN|nr:hypothetical protein GIB67_004532 [Kingdonia uniflora]
MIHSIPHLNEDVAKVFHAKSLVSSVIPYLILVIVVLGIRIDFKLFRALRNLVPAHPLVKSCFWELPRIGEIKINTDGGAKGNHGKGGIGCISCDCKGKVMVTLSKGLGLVTNFMAECEAIILGVELAAFFGWLISWKESDSTMAVEAFKTNNIPWI